MKAPEPPTWSRRDLLKLGLMSGAATLIGTRGLRPAPALGAQCYAEAFPTSPFVLSPFTDPLPIPPVLAPSNPRTWRDPRTRALAPPGPGTGQQDSDGGTHQVWTSDLGLPDPICYRIPLQVREHAFTTSLVLPINASGVEVIPPDGIRGPRSLPASTIYGFNGTFPGPRINAQYGRPVLVRFENHLDENPLNLDRQDFGAPDWAFLTHLHNGHTAPESDGNPHYKIDGYRPKEWCDNLYLNWPAGGDARNMQSFFWFHDHRMDHTGANVYKGMVGLFPIYDPAIDSGDEINRRGLRLAGVRRNNRDGTFSVDYDIPLAFYDCCLDDGVTPHQDCHNGSTGTHPEWWGKTFFQHFPNHGFVGDIFTVNGVAYPVLHVKRRKYRLRFLDASIARIYEFKLMQGTVTPAPGTQGQYQLPDGQQCMRFTQIASEGGLLPAPIVRDAFPLWPAKRREVIVDFTRYMDGTPTHPGDEIYLTNVLQMTNGRKPNEPSDPDYDPNYKVPVLKFVVGGLAPDRSMIPRTLRPLVPLPPPSVLLNLPHRRFRMERSGGFSEETEWLINGLPFDPLNSLAYPKWGSEEVWTIENGGGGWVHPLHIHEEEHRVIARRDSSRAHPDDTSKEDVVALDPGEEVDIYRHFRTFVGPYVCHCHNLAHEDHAMMFGWTIVP
ncbi:MAG: multicopper oxidase domain-containing protein [candidate division NC10 bacterium]|nr:multicopper oxidase domain-containing protein [candidate division NC10 bacterium]